MSSIRLGLEKAGKAYGKRAVPNSAPEANAQAPRHDPPIRERRGRPKRSSGRPAVIDEPIDLHGRRTPSEQTSVKMRLGAANDPSPIAKDPRSPDERLEDEFLVDPAWTWIEVMEKWRFLLERYSSSPDAEDERIQKLIRRAIGDMERLRRRGERR